MKLFFCLTLYIRYRFAFVTGRALQLSLTSAPRSDKLIVGVDVSTSSHCCFYVLLAPSATTFHQLAVYDMSLLALHSVSSAQHTPECRFAR